MESGPRISYTKTLEEQTLVDLSVSPYNLSMMLVWNNLADPHLSPFRDFARFSQTLTLKGHTFSEVIRKKHVLEVYANYMQRELTPHWTDCCFVSFRLS